MTIEAWIAEVMRVPMTPPALTPAGQAGNSPGLLVDDEANLMAAVTEATAMLTVGTVTTGPHA